MINEELDAIDIRILRALQENGKLTTKELAAKVNLSPSPTFERQKRLEREGYIERYTAIVNPRKVGLDFIVFCNIQLKKHSKEIGQEFITAIQDLDEVSECYNTSGDYDFMMKVHVRDMPHYQDFVLNTLGEIDSIGRLSSNFVIGEVKCSHAIPLPRK